jgi:hypothetical protein
MMKGWRGDVATKLREAGLAKKAERFEQCHQADEGKAYICSKCGHVEGYQPFSCMVAGCPYCSSIQGTPVREAYEDALLALWLKREVGEWKGRFWFLTFTYGVDDDEETATALGKVRKSFDSLAKWIIKTYGAGKSGEVAALEIGPKRLEESGRAGQIHVHAVLVLDSCKQIGRYRFIVGQESGQSLIVRVDFDAQGDIEKQRIEAKWIELIGKNCPVSRVYEVAPGRLPIHVDRGKVTESLERLGLRGDELKKAVYYNTRATIKSVCCELLKYVTKTSRLSPGALAKVIIAFHRKRRVWSFGVLYGKKRKDLADYLKDWMSKNGGKHPLGDRRCKCQECSKCGGSLQLESAWSIAQRDPAGMAGALRETFTRRGWLDTANNSSGQVSKRAPPALRRWLERLERGQAEGTARTIDLNDW